jgi:hypothetical protein
MIPDWLMWLLVPVGIIGGAILAAAARNTFR